LRQNPFGIQRDDSGLLRAPAKFARSKTTVPMRLAEMPGYERKLFLDFSYDLIAELAGGA